jgi:hypothetical protein
LARNTPSNSHSMTRNILALCVAKGHGGISVAQWGRDSMRALIAIAASAAMLVAQMPFAPAYAESAPPAPQVAGENSVIAQTFKAFPNGGEALTKQLVKVILANPKLAPDLVIYMRNAKDLNRAQKLAAENGLAAVAEQLRIKAADMGIVTKDTVIAGPTTDWWLIALGILAVGAAVCWVSCTSSPPGTTGPGTSSAI